MEFHDPEKSTPTVSQSPAEAFSDSEAIAGQGPDAKHTVDRAQSSADVHTSDDSPTDADPSTDDAAPDTEPDPEALTRVPSGPAYSAFSPAMKKWIITVVSFTSFISPMTANNYAALMVLRMVQSGGSSGTLALGYAVVADIATSSERGKYMGIVGAGINVGPSLSPVLGGVLAQYLGWRAIFWFCFIFSCAVMIPYILTVPETCRLIVGNGSIEPPGWQNMTVVDWVRKRLARRKQEKSGETQIEGTGEARPKLKLRFPNPLRALAIAFDKGLGLIILYNSLLYLVFIISVSTLSTQFKSIYGYNDLQIGLCYLPYGAGCFGAAIGQGYMLDWYYRRVASQIGFSIDRKRGDDLSRFPIEKARVTPLYFFVSVGLVAMILYGWILEMRTSVAAPLCLLFVIGLCITGSFGILNTLIVDLSPESPATAVAANNFVRCELGAISTAVIELMIGAMGTGWCFTFFALLAAVFMPILWVEAKYGIQWRQEKKEKQALRKARKEKREDEKREMREQKEREKGEVESGGG
ncbi:hypothetical protein SLS53_007888 [Cytospora paraplurivora]|uniref:Major facilitator superfamily (MFS) profile domain-containing protein n=1 Tax=Cytospora paraplurivora TaxID=2898453 RepID=A0AAN9U060_9PEZI